MFHQTDASGKLCSNYATITPAYGRDYKSAKEAVADFEANKDFQIQPSGQYINKEQIATGITVHIRYKNQTRDVLVEVTRPVTTA
jgi:hypothetical protein